MNKLLNITDVSKLIDLVNPKTKKPLNYILRYWEKEFKQIKPKIINKRRYYSKNQIDLIKLIKYLIKDKGMSVKGTKNILKSTLNSLDVNDLYSLKVDYQKLDIKNKTKKILEKIKSLKRNG
jgi:DNA-binding transcriptional MerR regulator